jgi:hypothetical protein
MIGARSQMSVGLDIVCHRTLSVSVCEAIQVISLQAGAERPCARQEGRQALEVPKGSHRRVAQWEPGVRQMNYPSTQARTFA